MSFFLIHILNRKRFVHDGGICVSFLHTTRMDLLERLTLHLKRDIALQAEGFESGAGVLHQVDKRFIRMGERYFVPSSMQEIVLFDIRKKGGRSPSKCPDSLCRPIRGGSAPHRNRFCRAARKPGRRRGGAGHSYPPEPNRWDRAGKVMTSAPNWARSSLRGPWLSASPCV